MWRELFERKIGKRYGKLVKRGKVKVDVCVCPIGGPFGALSYVLRPTIFNARRFVYTDFVLGRLDLSH